MSSKLIFLLLTALLLVQCSVGKPMPDADTAAEVSKEQATKNECIDDDSSDSTSEEKSQETALASFLIGEFTEITDMILNSGKKLIEDVIVDVSAMEEKSEALKIKTDKLTELVKKLDKINLKDKKKMGCKLALLVEMDDLLESFNTTAIEKPNAEDLIIEASLKKNRIEKIIEDVKGKFLEFTERFYVAADKYWDSLSPEEQTEKKAFAEWLKLFKDETDVEKKITLFEEIFELSEKSE